MGDKFGVGIHFGYNFLQKCNYVYKKEKEMNNEKEAEMGKERETRKGTTRTGMSGKGMN